MFYPAPYHFQDIISYHAQVMTVTDQLTDHTTQSVTTGCIYVHSTTMRPKRSRFNKC